MAPDSGATQLYFGQNSSQNSNSWKNESFLWFIKYESFYWCIFFVISYQSSIGSSKSLLTSGWSLSVLWCPTSVEWETEKIIVNPLSMSISCQCQPLVDFNLLAMSTCCQWQPVFNVNQMSISTHCQCQLIVKLT